MKPHVYLHGTEEREQQRLALLNGLTNPAFLEFLQLRPEETVLEVGSGLGILTNEVADRVLAGQVIGIEYSIDQLAKAVPLFGNLQFVRGDAHELPFADNSFDLVYCRYVLEHVREPQRVIAEMHRVLKPGGRVCLQENNILSAVFYPDCPLFDSLWHRYAQLYDRLGVDALIGKRLFSLALSAGFANCVLTIQPEIHYSGLPTFKPWIENLIGNTESSIDDLIKWRLATRDEITAAFTELRDFAERPDAAAYFYWNRLRAIKPHSR